MWTDLRRNIEEIRQQNNISESDFKPVDIQTWQEIERKIQSTFCNVANYKDQFAWLWSDFKLDTYSVHFNKNFPFDELIKLVDHSEMVWLFVNETVNERTKFWVYEGKIKTIVFVLGESFVDEVYIACKKYEWLLCVNHHDIIIATGRHMPEKLRQVEKELANRY